MSLLPFNLAAEIVPAGVVMWWRTCSSRKHHRLTTKPRNLLRLQMRVTFENYVDIQQDIGNFERDAADARQLFKEQTGGLLSAEEGELLDATANLINDLEKAHLVRAILLADLIRQTGGALSVDIDHWDTPAIVPQPNGKPPEPLPGQILPKKDS